jgi:MFS family permease
MVRLNMNEPSASAGDVPETASERPPGIFYGWIVVATAFTVLFIAYGIQFSFGIFMHYISTDTGWDRGSLSLPYSVYVFIYSALGFVTGRLTDRYGPRAVISVGGLLLGCGVMLIGRSYRLWELYLSLGLIAACGMSAAYVPCNATVVRWFTVRRGLALSITSSGASFGMFIFPPIATALIVWQGWRVAYMMLGLTGLAIIVLCSQFIVRDPERLGLSPDGGTKPPDTSTPLADELSDGAWTLESARGTRAFWILTTIFSLTWIVVFIPMVHIVPFAMDLGLPQFRAAMTISVIGLAGFAGRLLIGPISDRVGRLICLGVCLVFQAFSFAGFVLSRELILLYFSAALFGLSYGGVTALFPALVGDLFGRLAVGAIVGFIFAVAGAPAAFGPLIAGYIYDLSGSYRIAFELSAILNLCALGLVLLLKRPSTPVQPSAATIQAEGLNNLFVIKEEHP